MQAQMTGYNNPTTPTALASTMSNTLKLNPAAVRERAKSVAGCQEIIAKGESVLSFLVTTNNSTANNGSSKGQQPQPQQQQQEVSLARVNIFVDSGTVGTCRVLGGKVRQTFRRNVTSLDVVERLLKHPESLVAIDESLIGYHDNEAVRPKPVSPIKGQKQKILPTSKSAINPTPESYKKELELADVGLCILQGEREKLQLHLESIVQKEAALTKQQQLQLQQQQQQNLTPGKKQHQKKQQRQDSSEDDDTTTSVSGMEFQFSLPADVMLQVDQCLQDIHKMGKLVRCVATNGKGTVFLYGNGGVAYTPSIPRALYQKLRHLRNSSFSARPSYISLGTRDRYYVAFNDGTADWKGPKALDKVLKKTSALPKSVAFGSSYDTFFVVFDDGSWQYQGRGIPDSLQEKLASRRDRPDLTLVNLGPSGEWFLKARNGRMWWSGLSDSLDRVIASILKDGNYLHFLDFGENGSYFVSYDDQ